MEFRLGDMYAADVRPATVVTLFLHPQPNLKLRPKLRSELQRGARVVSYIWDMGDWPPDDACRVSGRRIFVWWIQGRDVIRHEGGNDDGVRGGTLFEVALRGYNPSSLARGAPGRAINR